ncbi:MAG: heme o synthase [bacterium]|nr:heme o synthase [bacterium]
MFKDYYSLTKFGLVLGNVITVIAGFMLVAGGHIDLVLFFSTIAGISLVMASGCVFNNYIDRDIDAVMSRTKDRPLVMGRISGRAALIFGALLGIAGFSLLALTTNLLTLGVALFGFFFYVVMYSIWWKRRSVYGTFVGSIAGAVPPLVGYTAAGGGLDLGALILFAIMVSWQMPHFFAIAIRRGHEYAAAGIPVLPVKRGVPATKFAMMLYVNMFIVTTSMLTVFGYTGLLTLVVALALGLTWLGLCLKGLRLTDASADVRWARTMFLFSLAVMMLFFITVIIDVAL